MRQNCGNCQNFGNSGGNCGLCIMFRGYGGSRPRVCRDDRCLPASSWEKYHYKVTLGRDSCKTCKNSRVRMDGQWICPTNHSLNWGENTWPDNVCGKYQCKPECVLTEEQKAHNCISERKKAEAWEVYKRKKSNFDRKTTPQTVAAALLKSNEDAFREYQETLKRINEELKR